jgi:ferrous iron transport protein A
MINNVEIVTSWLDLVVGDTVKITKLNPGAKPYRLKLMALGLLPGTIFNVSRVAPLGDPIEIRFRGFSLTLRKQEAQLLLIEKIA